MHWKVILACLSLCFCAGDVHWQADQFLQRLDFDDQFSPFYHGVASGDPTSNSVILWTRITSAQPEVVGRWRIATDTAMQHLVQQGTFQTGARQDFTVKIDVQGLSPNSYYYYDFFALGTPSIVGRTKTAPTGNISQVRFGVFSCASYGHGYFNAYRHLAEQNDVDAVLHLGDYIYEYGNAEYGALRRFAPDRETVSLSDYRMRYSFYRLDPDLRDLHQQFPFIAIWDDHESADDSWEGGAQNHTEEEGDWELRKAAAQQAYLEWMPVRAPEGSIYRKVSFGNLVELFFLDTRLEGRSEQYHTDNAYKTMLGSTQYNWLISSLKNSKAKWKVIAQQVMMAPLNLLGFKVNEDQWDSYAAERAELLYYIQNNGIKNVVVLTGDIHSSWANDLPLEGYRSSSSWQGGLPCENAAAVEFVTTSVTSPGLKNMGGLGPLLAYWSNKHVQYADLERKGYMIIDISLAQLQADWRYMKTIDYRNSNLSHIRSYMVRDSISCVEQSAIVTTDRSGRTSQAKSTLTPAIWTPGLIQEQEQESLSDNITLDTKPFSSILPMQNSNRFHLFPNPTRRYTRLNFSSNQDVSGRIEVYRGDGLLMFGKTALIKAGSNDIQIDLGQLTEDVYSIVLKDEAGRPLNNSFVLKMADDSVITE